MAQAVVDEIPPCKCLEDELVFFSTIDEATKVWLKNLSEIWNIWKKCDGLIQMLTDYFETAPNPYLSTLRIVVNTPDFNYMKMRSSLAFTVIEEYGKWLEQRKELYKQCLATDLKIAAFRLISKQNNMQFIKMFATTYDFMEDKQVFLKIIERMVQERKYKEAAQYATVLHLQEYFQDPEILLLPLILQGKCAVVEDFVAGFPEIQRNLIIYLDSLISPGNNMKTILDDFIKKNNIQDVKMSIQIRPVTKLISRYIKLYNLPPELFPNLTKKRSEGALQFLIHKRYVDGTLSIASWREMVREAVGDDGNLQSELIRMLTHANDAKEGLYWAQEFNVPKKQWPWAISYFAEKEESARTNGDGASTSRGNTDDWNSEEVVNYHKLQLSSDSIKVVDNTQSFEEFLDNGLKGVSIVGIDSEWKPSFGIKRTELALIQISTDVNVYILDVTTLGKKLSDLWMELGITLFENKDILKLGFGISHDMAVISNSLPALSKIRTHGPGYLDIVHLWKKLVDEYKFTFPHERDQRTNQSLSRLVELCLGQRLNKSDQFSNWEQRPLRESQIKYAALDAYCLLEIYEVLQKQCARLDIPFQEICAEIQQIPHRHQKKNIKKPMQSPKPDQKHPNHNREGHQRPLHGHKPQQRSRPFVRPKYPNNSIYPNNPRDRNQLDYVNKPVYPHNAEYSIQPEHPIKPASSRKSDPQNGQQNALMQMYPQQVEAHKWRVVCDSMLGGLTSKLRMCGCDCVNVVFDQGGDRSVKLAMRENRVLLTRNKGCAKFAQHLPPSNCYRVLSDTPDEQLCEVLNHFHVVVTKKDIFSRCQICNNDEFAKVPKTVMDKLVKSFASITRKNCYHVYPAELDGVDVLPNNSEVCSYQYGDNTNHFERNEDRTWCLSTNSLNINTCTTKYQMRVQIDKVPVNVLKNVQLFYVCEHCGKVYWDGTHLEHTLNGVLKDRIMESYTRVG